MSISCVDLFCGAGGLTRGLTNRGITVSAGIDIDPACEYPYETNNNAKFIKSSVEHISGNDLVQLFEKGTTKLLAGCAPCQPFSNYTRGKGKENKGRWSLLKEFARLINESKPELITMENVPQLYNHHVFNEFLDNLKEYHVWTGIIDCSEYGLPQKRKRLVLLGSKVGEISIIPPSHSSDRYVTVRDALQGLPPLSAGETDPNDALHACSALNGRNLERIRQSRPGGSWKDWDKELIAECHKRTTGKGYYAVYGRMEWDKPSPTMTTLCYGFGNGRFGHPEQDRAISLREAAILQSFPIDYRFVKPNEKVRFRDTGRLIGNAVPVRLAEVIADSFLAHLKQTNNT